MLAVVLLIPACAPVSAATQEPELAQQEIEQSVALTVAAQNAQAQNQQLIEQSVALTIAAQNAQATDQQASAVTSTNTPEVIETVDTLPDIENSPTVTTPAVPTPTGTLDPNAPKIETISPNTGFTTGGAIVTITGTNFAVGKGKTVFYFGNTPATDVKCESTTQCTAKVPEIPDGTGGNVKVTAVLAKNAPGASTEPDTFIYITPDPEAPLIERIEPREGPTRGGTEITITGKNFKTGLEGVEDVTQFLFGESLATDVVCEIDTQCKAKTPAGAEGIVIVVAQNGEHKSQHIPSNSYDAFKYTGIPKYGCSVLTTAPKKSKIFKGGDHFVIKWIVANTGTSTWPAGIDVKYSSGVRMSSSTALEIPVALNPNDTYALPPIGAIAPNNPGTYYMSWIVEGMGCDAYIAITVE